MTFSYITHPCFSVRYASRPHTSVGRSLLSSKPFSNFRNGIKNKEKRFAQAMRRPSGIAPSSPAPAPAPAPAIILPRNPPLLPESPAAQAASAPDPPSRASKRSGSNHKVIIWALVGAASASFVALVVVVFILRCSKVGTVKPWATGLSGQLQRAFVSGKISLHSFTRYASIVFIYYCSMV